MADGRVEVAIGEPAAFSFNHHLRRLETAARTAASTLGANSIPFKIAGAMAAYLHVNAVEPVNALLTPGVDNPEIEAGLPEEMRARLHQVRATR